MEFDSIKQQPILVIGAGSIGERHIGILQELGFSQILVYRQRRLPLRNIPEHAVTVFSSWTEVADRRPFAAIICTPTAQHSAQLRDCLRLGMHVLVEKPLSGQTEELQDFASLMDPQEPLHVQIAYMLRYHPAIERVQEHIQSGRFGPLLHSQSYWGEYLPDWHPWEDYRDSYAARRELGGGVALTLSHDIDLACWLHGGLPEQAQVLKQDFSPLEVNVESAADLLLRFPGGAQANIHLNFFERIPRRQYRLVFQEASVTIDYFANQLTEQSASGMERIDFPDFQRNQMFSKQAADFFTHCLTPSREQSLQNLALGIGITNLCL